MMAAGSSSLSNLTSTMQTLSCMKNVREILPPSFSLHSIDLLDLDPNEAHPKMISLTLRTLNNDRAFENRRNLPSLAQQSLSTVIKVVHGTEEVHSTIRKVCVQETSNIDAHNPINKESTDGNTNDNEGVSETNVNGVWTLSIGSIPFDKDFEGIKLSCRILEGLIRTGWEVVISPSTTITPGYELSTWILKQVTTPALHTAEVSAFAIGDGFMKVVRDTKNVEVSNVIRRAVKKCIKDKESSDSPLKRYTPASNCSEDKEKEEKDCNDDIHKNDDKDTNAHKIVLPPSCKESIGRLFGSKAIFKDVRDDPNCPDVFHVKELKNQIVDEDSKTDTKLLSSNLILEAIHLLFCRQWKLIAFSKLPAISNKTEETSTSENESVSRDNADTKMAEVYFFCKDGRILPALGQQTFAMIEIEYPNILRLHNASKELSRSVGDLLKESGWKTSINENDDSKSMKPNVLKYSILEYKSAKDDPNESNDEQSTNNTNNRVQSNQSISLLYQYGIATRDLKLEEQVEAAKNQRLIGKLLLAMNQQGLNLYATTQLTNLESTASKNIHRTQFIFRQSNVGYSQSMCLNLSGHNRLFVLGGDTSEVEVIRNAIQTRWPYPITKDLCISATQINKTNENESAEKKNNAPVESSRELIWLFKVKRYPWAISYGSKKVDRTVETMKYLIPQLSVPSPQNMDPDSGKSLIIFILKDLARLGWRVQTTANIFGDDKPSTRYSLSRATNPNSIFLLR